MWKAIIKLFKGRNEIPKNVLVGTASKDDIRTWLYRTQI
jgi:hypothetical protein